MRPKNLLEGSLNSSPQTCRHASEHRPASEKSPDTGRPENFNGNAHAEILPLDSVMGGPECGTEHTSSFMTAKDSEVAPEARHGGEPPTLCLEGIKILKAAVLSLSRTPAPVLSGLQSDIRGSGNHRSAQDAHRRP